MFRDSALDARNAFCMKPPEQRRIAEAFIGGPVRRSENTGFTLSFKDDTEDTQSAVVAQDQLGVIQANVANPYHHGLVSGTLTHQQGRRNTMVLTASYRRPESAQSRRWRSDVGVGRCELVLRGAGSVYNQPRSSHEAVESGATVGWPRVQNVDEHDHGAKIVVLDAFTGGGAQSNSSRTEHHFTLTDIVSWSAGRHSVKAGFPTGAAGDLMTTRIQPARSISPASPTMWPVGRIRSFQQVGSGHVGVSREGAGRVRAGQSAYVRSHRRDGSSVQTGRTTSTTTTMSRRVRRSRSRQQTVM